MKNTWKKSLNVRRRIFTTFSVALAMVLLVCIIVNYIYQVSVAQSYENLSNQTALIKSELYLQTISDSEQLKTIANFSTSVFESSTVKQLYENIQTEGAGEEDFAGIHDCFAPVFNSFRRNGLIDELEILLPGDMLVTASGIYDVSDVTSFEKASELDMHISNVRPGYIDKKKNVVHNAVPIKLDGDIVAILMGVVDVSKLGYKYLNLLKYEESHMHILEADTGNFVVNSDHGSPEHIDEIPASEEARQNYFNAVKKGSKGNLQFKSLETGEYIFAAYDSVDINQWRVIVAMPESVVFKGARNVTSTIVALASALVALMALYVWYLLSDEKKRIRLSLASSTVRKLLLEFGQRSESLKESLELICSTASARSAFFVDTDKDHYHYIRRDASNYALGSEERYKLLDCLIQYADSQKSDIFVKEISFVETLRESDPALYDIMKNHGINNTVFVVIRDKNVHASVIGVLNTRKPIDAAMLLSDIAMCFSMTVYNHKYLNATEQAAVTDTLTGLSNRTCYNRDMLGLKMRDYKNFACIYIDVNELHSYNNRYGHLAGDNMLVYVARAIQKEFEGHKAYRWGGDEFIVFAENVDEEFVVSKIEALKANVVAKKYHISVGYSYSEEKKDVELMLNEAEKWMYEAKAKYYQDKSARAMQDQKSISVISHVTTGNADVDAALSVMSSHYYGVYAVNMADDSARIILIPEAFDNILEEKRYFSKAIKIYVDNQVAGDYHRAFDNFMNYDVIKKALSNGEIPSITYRKLDGEEITLSVHLLHSDSGEEETLWVFEKNN